MMAMPTTLMPRAVQCSAWVRQSGLGPATSRPTASRLGILRQSLS